MQKFCLFLTLFIFSGLYVQAQEKHVETGRELIELIYSTYKDSWYPHLTFKQDMFRYRDDSLIRNEIWLVAYSAPGRLHIRYNDFDSGRGWLIINDSIYTYSNNNLIGTRPRLHELMTLGLDIYVTPPAITLPRITQMEFDLSVVCVTTQKGKLVYQVGDYNKQCFWVGKDDLLFVGIRKVCEAGVQETYFDSYKSFYGKPVATQIQYYQNGRLTLFEKYFEIRLPSSLPDEFYNPELFHKTRW